MTAGREWIERACFTYETHGMLSPSLWAEGGPKKCVAVPIDNESAEASTLLQVVLLGIMAQAVEATAIGTLHEAWNKTYDSEQPLRPGELASMADVDPTIKTCIISTWADLETNEVSGEMATVSIDDFGSVSWDHQTIPNPEGRLRGMVQAVISGEGLAAEDPNEVLVKVAESMNWAVLMWDE